MAVSAAMKARVKARMLKDKKGGSGATGRRSQRDKLQAAERREEARLAGLIDTATKDRFAGTERELGNQTRRVSAHGGTIDEAYKAYQATVAQLQAQQQAAMTAAGAQQAQVATGVAGAQTALGTGQAAQTAQTASQYGLDGGVQAQQAAQLAGQHGAVGGARAQAQAGSTAAIGLAQHERLAASSMAGIGGQMRDRKRNKAELDLLGQKGLELQDDKGTFRSGLRQQIRSQEAEQRLAEAALGVKATDGDRRHEIDLLNASIKRDEAKARAAENKTDNNRADRALQHQIDASARSAAQKDTELELRAQEADSPAAKLTPAKKAEWAKKKHRIIEARKRFNAISGVKVDGKTQTSSQVSVKLRAAGFTTSEINMARDLSKSGKGRLSAVNQTAAKAYFPGGIIPGGFIAAP